jgi:hypothetical protein
MFYMEGYAFVRYDEGVPYLRLQETTYFRSVLCQPGPRHKPRFSLLEDRALDPMRDGLRSIKFSEFSVDDDVKIVKGNYKNLPARVSMIYEDGETVQVYVDLRSKKILMDFPSTYLIRSS